MKKPSAIPTVSLIAIASNLGRTKSADDTKLPSSSEYDYMRFYQKP